jgi:hypothetical protein
MFPGTAANALSTCEVPALVGVPCRLCPVCLFSMSTNDFGQYLAAIFRRGTAFATEKERRFALHHMVQSSRDRGFRVFLGQRGWPDEKGDRPSLFSSGQRKGNFMMVLNAARAAVLFFYGTLPIEDVVVESVDLIEVNHCYDEEGKHVFDQVLFYDWSAQDRQYHVRAWRMLKHPSQIPYRDTVSGRYEATWHDGWVMRNVRATTFRETWTQHDPEVAARSQLPKELRRELIRPVSTSQRIP